MITNLISPSCKEIILDDVVRIDIYPDAELKTAVPRTLPFVLSIADMSAGTPLLTLALSNPGGMEYDTAPTVKLTEKTDTNGRTYAHELSVSFTGDIYNVRKAQRTLGTGECAVVYTLADGRRLSSLPLPNTSQLTVEENLGSAQASTLKVQLTSMSPLVQID